MTPEDLDAIQRRINSGTVTKADAQVLLDELAEYVRVSDAQTQVATDNPAKCIVEISY